MTVFGETSFRRNGNGCNNNTKTNLHNNNCIEDEIELIKVNELFVRINFV